jgi:hypothetical protein
MIRIKRLRYTPEPLRAEDALRDPYRVKVLRKVNTIIFPKQNTPENNITTRLATFANITFFSPFFKPTNYQF